MEPGIIKKLDEVVVNRIAAGEIIRRPANALKEMIENSLDAKSTSIQITVKNGGLKYLQIQDNGTGIRREDLEIVCERFTTSKLSAFEDLTRISTYGFRGEALASISHVAHLTIQTKTNDPTIKCAYKAQYSDGKLLGTVKPVAGSQGTQITVEDLFYNVSQRRQAFKSANEEYQKIVNMVSKYAVHNSHVNFGLKKIGDQIYSVRTANNNSSSLRTISEKKRENIGCIYGQEIAKELLDIELMIDERLKFEIDGFITNINYSSKKNQFLLFINHRLVESSTLKQQIDQIYSFYLAKGSYPFLYLSLKIRPENVDVNVHPTKHEVHFLYEEEIIGEIKLLIERTLLGKNDSRKFYTQKLLPGAMDPTIAKKQTTENDKNDSMEIDINKPSQEKIYAKDIVRTDAKIQKLEKFFGNATLLSATDSLLSTALSASTVQSLDGYEEHVKKKLNSEKSINKEEDFNVTKMITPTKTYKARRKILKNQTKLTSVLKLRQIIEENCHLGLRNILSDLIYVGTVDASKSLIQHETKLYLCNTMQLSEEIYYQILLYDFENFGAIELEDPDNTGLSIRELVTLALECPDSGWTEEDGPILELAETVTNILVEKSQMLYEYYNMIITDDGCLKQLPSLLENHRPSMAQLPMYILRLTTEVCWDNEDEFFETFSRETAKFYAFIDGSVDGSGNDNDNTDNNDEFCWKWYVEHVLYAALKEYFLPPKEFMHNKTFLQIANLSSLYKVFERC